MKDNLLILGAGQYGHVVREIADEIGTFEKIAFLDDTLSEVAIGKFDSYMDHKDNYKMAVVALGNPQLRLHWIEKLKNAGYELPVLKHPMSCVSSSAQIGEGTVVEPMAVVQAGVKVGKGCLLCSNTVLKHNCVVSDGCYIDCNSTVMPEATVPAGTRVNSNSVYFFRN